MSKHEKNNESDIYDDIEQEAKDESPYISDDDEPTVGKNSMVRKIPLNRYMKSKTAFGKQSNDDEQLEKDVKLFLDGCVDFAARFGTWVNVQ